MTNVKAPGTGCANCKTTLKLSEEVAEEKGVAATRSQAGCSGGCCGGCC